MMLRQEEQNLHRLRRERIARTKKILRWMPRRSNVHKYPVLKWFAIAARKRLYFWSFRVNAVVPAIYAGTILALLPLYGIQIPLALLCAYIFRANLPILTSLQFITNPLTVIPIYLTSYQIGRVILKLFTYDSPHLSMGEMSAILRSFQEGNWVSNIEYFLKVWLITGLGGLVLGLAIASIASAFYKFTAKEVALSYERLKQIQAGKHNTKSKADEE
jgi:hypothetical protein